MSSIKRAACLVLATSLALGLTACESDEGGPATDVEVDLTTYPAGPYGTSADQVIENLSFDLVDGSSLDIQSLRQDYRFLFINTAAGWCSACRAEQGELQELADTFEPRGAAVLLAIFEDNNAGAADLDFAMDWQETFSLTIPIAIDSENVMGNYYDSTLAPMNILIDLQTAEIAYISTGSDLGTIEQTLDVLL